MFAPLNVAQLILAYSIIHLGSICEATCGVPYIKPLRFDESRRYNRIYNGNEAKKHSHPWQALVLSRFSGKIKKCGGSLIDWNGGNASDLVLTAAHCLVNSAADASHGLIEEIKFHYKRWREKGKYVGIPLVNISEVKVFLGVHELYTEDANKEKLSVVEMALGHYHQYSSREDIALLKLERKVAYNNFIQGICLPSLKEELPAPGSLCYVTGWGYLDDNRTEGRKLQQIEVEIFKSKCNSEVNTKTMFCAGSRTRNIGICAGDSGGPLTCQKGGKFVLYGVVSFSAAPICSHKEDPTVFAKVPFFIEWLGKEISGFSNGTKSR